MCAICGSVGLAAPCANTGAVSRHSVARPADNLTIMGTSISYGRRAVPCISRDWMQEDAGGSGRLDRADALNHDFRHVLATSAAERETGRERRPELPVEFRTQENTGAVQPRLDRLRPQTEQVGRFLHAHPFDDACNEDGAEGIGKLIDRLFQHRAYLALRHGFLRIAAGHRGWKMNDLRLLTIVPICLPVDGWLSAPQATQGFVHGDARDPRTEGSIAAKHVEAGKCAHVGFLHHILGFRVVAQDTARNAEQTPVVPRGYGANRGFV